MRIQRSTARRRDRAYHVVILLIVAPLLTITTLPAAATVVSPIASSSPSHEYAALRTLPPIGGAPDYQLGGAYTPDPMVRIVARDRLDPPATGRYSICYLNAFQTQPGERKSWPKHTLLRHNGKLVRDAGWPDEVLLDTSTAAKQAEIARIVARWITKCARDGFQAVEFDNLDSYTRSHGELRLGHNIALAKRLTAVAHRHGLAVGQKNTAEHTQRLKREVGFDFAIAESCSRWKECSAYTRAYGSRVIDIEYTDETTPSKFAAYCARSGAPRSMVLRDHDLRTPDQAAHRFQLC